MTSPGPLAGVVSSELCWSAHDNELRVHDTATLESHAGHSTAGLPQRALFRFFAESKATRGSVRGSVRGFVRESFPVEANPGPSTPFGSVARDDPSPTGGATRAVSGFRQACRSLSPLSTASPAATVSPMGSSSGSPPGSEGRGGGGGSLSPSLRGVSPRGGGGEFFGDTKKAGGNRKKGEKLVVRAVSAVEMRDGRTLLVCVVSARGLASEVHCLDPISGETLHVSTGLPIMLTHAAVVVPRLHHAPPLRPPIVSPTTTYAGGNHSGGGMGAVSEGDVDGDCEEVVVAVGGLGGRVRLVGIQIPSRQNWSPPYPYPSRGVREPAQWPRTAGNVPSEREGVPISALAAFSIPGEGGSRGCVMVAAGWEDGRWAVAPCFRPGDRYCYGGSFIGSVQVSLGSSSSDSWEACSAGDLATGDTGRMGAPLHIVHQEHVNGLPSPTVRIWVSTSRGFQCFEASAEVDSSSLPQVLSPLLTQHRPLVPAARPQCLRAMAVGGGGSLALMTFAALRPSDSSPLLVILDAGGGGGGGESGDASPPPPSFVAEVELNARCCSMSVVSANPHGVWVNPSQVKVFVRRGRSERGGDDDFAASSQAIYLKVPIIVAEASLSEAGRPRLRAWEHSHVGAALRVGSELEQLGLLAFCDTSQEELDPQTIDLVNTVGLDSLHYIIGGQDNLWGRPHPPTTTTSAGAATAGRHGDDQEIGTASPGSGRPGEADRNGIENNPDCNTNATNSTNNNTTITTSAGAATAGRYGDDQEIGTASPGSGKSGEADRNGIENNPDCNTNATNSANNTTITITTTTTTGTSTSTSASKDSGSSSSLGAHSPHRPDHDPSGRETSASLLLAARLQAAVALGLGPAVARALTATMPGARGEWLLPRDRPVQEWAIAVAHEAWEDARALVAPCARQPQQQQRQRCLPRSKVKVAVEALDALSRRSRQVERVLEASTKRCLQYRQAAEAAAARVTVTSGRRYALAQRVASSRMAEIAPLLLRLRRSTAAAQLTSRIATSALWLTTEPGLVWRCPLPPGSHGGALSERGPGSGGGGDGEGMVVIEGLSGRCGRDHCGGIEVEGMGEGGGKGGECGGGSGSAGAMHLDRGSGSRPLLPGFSGSRKSAEELSSASGSVSASGSGSRSASAFAPAFASGYLSIPTNKNEPVVPGDTDVVRRTGTIYAAGGGTIVAGERVDKSAPSLPRAGLGVSMVGRLRKRAGLDVFDHADRWGVAAAVVDGRSPGRGSRGGGSSGQGGGADCPLSILAEMTSVVGGVFETVVGGQGEGLVEGGGEEEGGSSAAAETAEAAACLLERGLAVVAYSVMGTAYSQAVAEEAWRAESGEGRADLREDGGGRSALNCAETAFDRFCEQVRLSPESRSQARISWLLDNRSTVTDAMPTAAAALLCPRVEAALGADPPLQRVAGEIVFAFGEGGGGGDRDGGGPTGPGAGVLTALAEETSAAAVAREGVLVVVPGGGGGGWGAGGEGYDGGGGGAALMQHGSGKRPRDSSPLGGHPLKGSTLLQVDRLTPPSGGGSSCTTSGGGRGGRGRITNEQTRKRRVVQESPPAIPTPSTPPCSHSGHRGDRGHTAPAAVVAALETPRRVSLAPATATNPDTSRLPSCPDVQTPGVRSGNDGGSGPYSGGDNNPENGDIAVGSDAGRGRGRGQTLWETPRGVGLTPSAPGRGTPATGVLAGGGDVGGRYRGRERGKTVWETPRGVGLTPRSTRPGNDFAAAERALGPNTPGTTEGASFGEGRREHGDFGAVATDSQHGDGVDDVAVEEGRGRRDRGRTVWETPRGVGLTPKVPLGLGRPDDRGGSSGEYAPTSTKRGRDVEHSTPSDGWKPRARGQTVWETPRGVGLTPKVPFDLGRDDGSGGSSGGYAPTPIGRGRDTEHATPSSDCKPRDRGEKMWETPRRVGLTPKPPTAASSSSGGSGSGSIPTPGRRGQDQGDAPSNMGAIPRARGKTLWETPRGVGLTPKPPAAARVTAPSSGSAPTPSRRGEDQGDAPSSKRVIPRARGETLWETPRGVGLTPQDRVRRNAEGWGSTAGGFGPRGGTEGRGGEEGEGEGHCRPCLVDSNEEPADTPESSDAFFLRPGHGEVRSFAEGW